MITTDALKYLPQMDLDSSRVVGCAGAQCQKSFTLANGFAVEAVVAEKLSIAFFCSRDRKKAPREVDRPGPLAFLLRTWGAHSREAPPLQYRCTVCLFIYRKV